MEDIGFDISGILTEEEADKLFEDIDTEETQPKTEQEKEPAEEVSEEPSEKVGVEDDEIGKNAVSPEGEGSSPNAYSSIASALKNDGIFPDFTDEELAAVKTPEDFAEMFEKVITARLDEKQRRIDEALGYGVQPDTVRMYEQTLQYLGSINEEALSAEGENGEDLRRQLIYNDLINRGYDSDKAKKKLEQSFQNGTDIDDAKDALEALNKFYSDGYKKVQDEAKRKADEYRENQKKQGETLKKMILEDEIKLGDTKLDEKTCKRVYDAISKPVYKDKETGRLLTAIQKFQQDNPLEFLRQIGLWFTLTDGGKNLTGFTKEQVRAEKNKNIRELARKINTTSLHSDGSLSYASGYSSNSDPLLSDDWKVG